MDMGYEGGGKVQAGEATEGEVTSYIECFTSKVPSVVYLSLALAAMGASLALKASKKEHGALFVGQWAAPFLIMGLYNKLVKQQGSDATTR